MIAQYRRISDGMYPVSEQTIKTENPNVSFPAQITEDVARSFGYEIVFPTPQPTPKRWQRVQEGSPVKTSKGTWETSFELVDLEFPPQLDQNNTVVKTSEDVRNEFITTWKEELKKTVTDRRYSVETGGITLPNGVKIKTDRESQAQLSSAYSSLKNGLITDTQWKGDNGEWVLVTLTEIEPIAQAVAAHVRACFAAEKQHFESIDAITTFEGLDQYNTNTGWPA